MNNLTHQGQLISAPSARAQRALSLTLSFAFSLCVVSMLSCATLSAEPTAPTAPAEATKPAEATTPTASPQPSPSTEAQAATTAEPAEAQPKAEASASPSSDEAKAAREAEKEQRLEDLRYKHLWIAYSLIWLVIFSFIRSTWKRSEAVSARLDELKGRLKALEERG